MRPEPDSSGSANVAQGSWDVRIRLSGHQIIRVAQYCAVGGGVADHEEPDEVIWPTWAATIEDEAAVTASPLADLQRYWSTAGNRLRESAKWMATVLGAALAAIIGTSPVSGLSSHNLHVSAALIGVAGLLCLGATMLMVLRVMQPPAVSFEDAQAADERIQEPHHLLQPIRFWANRYRKNSLRRWKQIVESHQDLYLPYGVPSLGELRWSIGLEEATLVQLSRKMEDPSDQGAADRLITAIGEYYALQSTQQRGNIWRNGIRHCRNNTDSPGLRLAPEIEIIQSWWLPAEIGSIDSTN